MVFAIDQWTPVPVGETQHGVNAYLNDRANLIFRGKEYRLPPAKALIMNLLLPGRPVPAHIIGCALWPIDADYDDHTNPLRTIRVHVHQLRKLTPLLIHHVSGLGYKLEEPFVSDPQKTRPAVDNAIRSVRGAFKENSTLRERMTHGKIDYNHETGIGKTHHETDDVAIDVIVTPKETEGPEF